MMPHMCLVYLEQSLRMTMNRFRRMYIHVYIYIYILYNECLCFWSHVFHNILFTVYNMYNYKHSHMSLHLQVQYKIPLQNLVYPPRNQHGTWKIGLFQKDTGTSLPSIHFRVFSFREDMQHFFTPTLFWTSRRLVIIVQIPRDQPFVQGPFVQGPFRWHGSGRFCWFLLQFLWGWKESRIWMGSMVLCWLAAWCVGDSFRHVPFDMQQSFDIIYVYRNARSANLMQIIIYMFIYTFMCVESVSIIQILVTENSQTVRLRRLHELLFPISP